MEEDSDHETSQIIVDTTARTVYENRLRVRGREGGEYQCAVSGRNSITSASFRVQGRRLYMWLYMLTQSKRQDRAKQLHLKTAIFVHTKEMSCLRQDSNPQHAIYWTDALYQLSMHAVHQS